MSLYGENHLSKRSGLASLCLVLSILLASFPCASKSASSEHHVNPAGTFIRYGKGYIYAANVQPIAAIAKIINNGTVEAVKGVFLSNFVLNMTAMIPYASLALAAGYLWQYRVLVFYWDYYLKMIQGSLSFRSYRLGRMPVYISSSEIDQQLIINWLYPVTNDQPLQLELTLTPVEKQPLAQLSDSPVEAALHNLIDNLHSLGALRLRVWVFARNLHIAVQGSDGKWAVRFVPRPDRPLLEEQVQAWEGRPTISEALSLLTPSTLQFIADSLLCRENLQNAWQSHAINTAQSKGATLFHIGMGESGLCDYLAVSDQSSYTLGFAGYQHLRTGESCEEASQYVSHYSDARYENHLVEHAHNSLLPGWVSTTLFRLTETTLAAGSRSMLSYSRGKLPTLVPSWNLFGSWGSSSTETIATEPAASTVLEQVRDHAPKGLSVLAPGFESMELAGPMCTWRKVEDIE